jgi:hypothetical protein
MTDTKQKGNGLGQNKVPTMNPAKLHPYGMGDTGQKNIPNEKRPGPGAKQ